MKLTAPDYYPYFICAADGCGHSCCKGWEIDIDEDTYRLYQRLPGKLGEKLRENIEVQDGIASFRLMDEDRCPFLQQDGLCELILKMGEGILCQICSDHPRFRRDYADRTEIGLGLCCEEAARLILNHNKPMQMIVLDDDGTAEMTDGMEGSFFTWRSGLFAIVQNRSCPLEERVAQLCIQEKLPCLQQINPWEYHAFLLALERLDPAWTDLLSCLGSVPSSPGREWDDSLEQLLMYLLYRHLPASLDDGDRQGWLLFAIFCWQLIRFLFPSNPEPEKLAETARLFSSEIEYSDENTLRLKNRLRSDWLI